MSTPFLGEIKVISFNFPPKGWAFCNGQLLGLNQNQALFSLLGTSYGGDGVSTFALPNLQGRSPLHQGSGFVVGQPGGESSHTLTLAEMPVHNHLVSASTAAATTGDPTGALWATTPTPAYSGTANTQMNAAAIGNAGGNQPHQNMAPFLVLNFVIALTGIYPSRD